MTQTKKILIIEDEQAVREVVLDILGAEDFLAIGAENGRVGVQLAQEHQPDLIICDIMMPELNGYDVLGALQQEPATAVIPFIFLSAKSDKPDIRQGIELGADNYLTKPFTRSELLGAIAARFASLDQQNYPIEEIPKFLGNPSANWVYSNLINPQLEKDYDGWYIAVEPETGKCFLGTTHEAAHQAAQRVFPEGVFYYRQIKVGEEDNSLLENQEW